MNTTAAHSVSGRLPAADQITAYLHKPPAGSLALIRGATLTSGTAAAHATTAQHASSTPAASAGGGTLIAKALMTTGVRPPNMLMAKLWLKL
jgi:hypothetical protein